MNRSSTVGMPSFHVPPSGFGISTRLTGFGMYVPLSNCSRISRQCFPRWMGSSFTVIPSIPAAPRLRFTRLNALFKFLPSQISSISRSDDVGLSGASFAVRGSSPSRSGVEVSPSRSVAKASSNWVFRRFPLTSSTSYLPLQSVRAFSGVSPPASPARFRRLLCPLLTSAARSGHLTISSVTIEVEPVEILGPSK